MIFFQEAPRVLGFQRDSALTVLGALLGTAASLIITAFFQYFSTKQLKSATDELAKQAQLQVQEATDVLKREAQAQVEKVYRSLSTHLEGGIEEYLPKIAEIIRSSKGKMWIMAPLPTHGSFTQSQSWLAVKSAVDHLSHRTFGVSYEKEQIPSKIILYSDDKHRRQGLYAQYAKLKEETAWKEWKMTKPNCDHIADLLSQNASLKKNRNTKRPTLKSLTLDQLVEERVDFDNYQAVCGAFPRFEPIPGKELYPFFCWISEAEAVFSLRSEDKQGRYIGTGIYTKDEHLIAALETAFKFYYERAVSPKKNGDGELLEGSEAKPCD